MACSAKIYSSLANLKVLNVRKIKKLCNNHVHRTKYSAKETIPIKLGWLGIVSGNSGNGGLVSCI